MADAETAAADAAAQAVGGGTTVLPLTERERKVYLCKLAEQAERYDQMAEYISEVAEQNEEELNAEERNLMSVAFKNSVASRRAAWRVVKSLEEKERSRGNFDNSGAASAYKRKIESELLKTCDEVLRLVRTVLLVKASTGEDKVFYLKMKGDYLRYKAEICVDGGFASDVPDSALAQDGTGFGFAKDKAEKEGGSAKEAYEESESLKEQAKAAYQEAMNVASTELLVTSPIRLGLALNFSVFYYEILHRSDEACKLARQAFEDAIAELDSVTEDVYKDSTLIMQLLRDNLTLWTSDER